MKTKTSGMAEFKRQNKVFGSEAWSKLPNDEKAEYNAKAQGLTCSYNQLDSDSQKAYRKTKENKIEKLLKELYEECGVSYMVNLFHKDDSCLMLSSDDLAHISYMKNDNVKSLITEVEAYFEKSNFIEMPCGHNDLVVKLRSEFRKVYKEFDESARNVAWTQFEQKILVAVDGNGEDLNLKDPKHHTIAELNLLITACLNKDIHIRRAEVDTVPSTVEAVT